MYDINYKNLKKGILFFIPFILVGILFGILIWTNTFQGIVRKQNTDAQATAIFIDENYHNSSDNGTYSPIYTFIANGKEYKCHSKRSTTLGVDQNQKTIYYKSNSPLYCVTPYDTNFGFFDLIFVIFPLLFIIMGVSQIIKTIKRINLVKELNKTGVLIKQLKYELAPTGREVNNKEILAPVVYYTQPNGVTLKLKGDPRHDRKLHDEDGLVDLVIDPNNPDNYFIDFEINRLDGNRPSDYSNQFNNPQFNNYDYNNQYNNQSNYINNNQYNNQNNSYNNYNQQQNNNYNNNYTNNNNYH